MRELLSNLNVEVGDPMVNVSRNKLLNGGVFRDPVVHETAKERKFVAALNDLELSVADREAAYKSIYILKPRRIESESD